MREAKGDIFEIEADAVCITTNGAVRKDGRAVMGRGCALEASKLFPQLPQILGDKLTSVGNRVHILLDVQGTSLLSFPVKPIRVMSTGDNVVNHMKAKFPVGSYVPGWAAKAMPDIIEESARQLLELANQHSWTTVVLPRPGCGAGELQWSHIKDRLDRILDDRFICMTW